jgi:3-isopropylmalate/(R)-2-methylmalate dehydratase small subunit
MQRKALLEGLDAIGVTLAREADIAAWQAGDRERRPWIWRLPT